MTDAELDAKEKRLRQLAENMEAAFSNPEFHGPLFDAADALAALRRELRLIQAERDGIGSLLLDVQNDCIAEVQKNAKMAAALRGMREHLVAHPRASPLALMATIEAALTPAAPEAPAASSPDPWKQVFGIDSANPASPSPGLRLETTPAMRARQRELSTRADRDDYDRVTVMLLDDLAKCLAYIAPLEDFAARSASPSPGQYELSQAEFARVMDILGNPPPPTEKLKELMRMGRKRMAVIGSHVDECWQPLQAPASPSPQRDQLLALIDRALAAGVITKDDLQ